MLIAKIGGVPAHPANVHRLLHDEEQLVLVFPEGRKGSEKLYKDRYRLRRFGRGGFVEAAMRARAPIVPVASSAPRRRCRCSPTSARPAAHRAHLLPDHAVVPRLGLAAGSPTCRRSSGSASWSRSPPTSGARSRGRTTGSCRRSPRTSAPASRRSCYEMLAAREVGVARVKPRPHHRARQLLGRPPRPGARARHRRSRRSSASTRRTRRSRSSGPSSSASAPSTRCCAGSSRRPRSTRSWTRG